MFHRDHRTNHTAPVGLILAKLVLGVGAHLLQRTIEKKIDGRNNNSKPPANAGQANGKPQDRADKR